MPPEDQPFALSSFATSAFADRMLAPSSVNTATTSPVSATACTLPKGVCAGFQTTGLTASDATAPADLECGAAEHPARRKMPKKAVRIMP